MRPMTMAALLFLGLGCGDGTPARPTRYDCVAAVAHEWTLEERREITVPEMLGEVTDLGIRPSIQSEADLMTMIENSELASGLKGEGARRIARCLAERSPGHVICVRRSQTLAAARQCPP